MQWRHTTNDNTWGIPDGFYWAISALVYFLASHDSITREREMKIYAGNLRINKHLMNITVLVYFTVETCWK